jgi:hypothetical protein
MRRRIALGVGRGHRPAGRRRVQDPAGGASIAAWPNGYEGGAGVGLTDLDRLPNITQHRPA